MIKRPTGCFDAPDRRDWDASKLFGDTLPPDILTNEDVNLVNIRARSQTKNNCTSMGGVGTILMMIRIGESVTDAEDNYVLNLDGDPDKLWGRQHEVFFDENGKKRTMGTAALDGDYIQNMLKTLKYVGVPILIGNKWINVKIKGYSIIKDGEEEMWLRKGHPIITGFDWIYKKINNKYYSTDKNGFLWDGGSGSGHCVPIASKDPNYGVFNSHGERWGINQNGTAYLTEKKLKDSYTKYIIRLDWDQIRKDLAN